MVTAAAGLPDRGAPGHEPATRRPQYQQGAGVPGASARPTACSVRAERRKRDIRPHPVGWDERSGVNPAGPRLRVRLDGTAAVSGQSEG
jgi:hypothetical protein